MSASPSWSFDDIHPIVRERAEASARRSGMSFSEWLNAMIGDASSATRERRVLDRLDPLARDLDDLPYHGGSRRQDNDSIASRGARLARSEPANGLHRPAPFGEQQHQHEPGSLEAAIAEISARQFDLDVRSGQDARFLVPSAKLSKLEQQITRIMRQVETMPSAGAIEMSLQAFRAELSEMRQSITDAMPRRAMESLETEIRALSRRIDDSRDDGADGQALAGVERSLDEIREALRALTPAEQLAGYDEAIRKLTGQLDQIVRDGSEDREFIRQLEDAVAALRVIVASVASNEALATLGDDVRTLSAKLDLFGRNDHSRNSADTSQVEDALRALSQRMDRLPSEFAASTDYGHLDQRVSSLLERLEAAPTRHALDDADSAVEAPRRKGVGMDPEMVDAIKRELADLRIDQTANDRQTQDTLEVVNSTLGHVVDRLAMIEGDLRSAWPAPAAAAPLFQPSAQPSVQPSLAALQPAPRPDLPNPAVYLAPHSARALQDAAESGNIRTPIAPELPPDFPLEPGTFTSTLTGAPSAFDADREADRAASPEPESDVKPNFIAAARRAARAAAAAAAQPEKARFKKAATENAESSVTAKIRSLLVGASVVVIVLGSFRMAMTLFEGSAPNSETSAVERSIAPQPDIPPPSTVAPVPGKQSSLISVPVPQQEAITGAAGAGDVTGALGPLPATTQAAIAPGESLPEAIGGVRLREAALKGDAGAAYEIATRLAEGRGVAPNFTEAAKWYERAAQGGIVPAMFRYGALFEKGIGVKKDLDAARRYYLLAADRGNAKAMHNLAVLEADGGSTGANFKAAGGWFRKAAERGVVDSQYNLGILYARGIGVEQNLAESYKWFSLAAAQGDADSNAKRDDVAKKLDPQSLAAAKLATQTFTPEPQPVIATSVAAPAGGWDAAAAQTANAAPAVKAAPRRLAPLK